MNFKPQSICARGSLEVSGICVAALLTACGAASSGLPDGGGTGGGQADGGGAGGGGSDNGDPHFCAPCVQSSDCGAGALCLGDVGHCSSDCSNGQACPSQTACETVSFGKARLGQQCSLTTDACGSLDDRVAGLDCSDSWAGFADGFFETTCRSCHQGWPASNSDLQASLESIRVAIDTRSMPAGGTALSSADRLRILTYLACGAPTPSQAPPSAARH